MVRPAVLIRFGATLAAAVTALAVHALADDPKVFEVTLKGNAMEPAEIHVPKDTPFVIKFTNANDAPAELEAKELKIEKVAAGKSDIVVRVKAMPAGKYLFVDEYQEDVAKGYVIAE